MNQSTISALALVGLVLAGGSCIESRAVVAPEVTIRLTVRLRAELDSALANTPASLSIARLRAEVRRGTSREVLASQVSETDPDEPNLQPVAQLEFEVKQGEAFDIEGDLRLIGEDEVVQWSGIFGPAAVDTHSDTWQFTLEMGRGDLANLAVTGISVSGLENGLLAGETAPLSIEVGGSGHDIVVFWGSKDPAIATVDGAGNVTGVSAGEAMIVAAAGKHSVAVVVEVLPNSASRPEVW
ncbi:MAG TPA: Ig-like domain-containing protein [Longimicrobiales bacterium]|nr:Ig-like domain-containing protein [Longimicrobiales bacterium]